METTGVVEDMVEPEGKSRHGARRTFCDALCSFEFVLKGGGHLDTGVDSGQIVPTRRRTRVTLQSLSPRRTRCTVLEALTCVRKTQLSADRTTLIQCIHIQPVFLSLSLSLSLVAYISRRRHGTLLSSQLILTVVRMEHIR